MNVVNNLEIIEQYLEFEDPDQFYFIEIIKRRKENPNIEKNAKLVKTFHINSKNQLLEKFTEIQNLCKFYNARAYIDLNRKSFKNTAFIMLQKITDCLINETYKSIKSGFDSACGEHTIEEDKKWLIDVDVKNEEILENIIERIEGCESEYINSVIGTIPTLNGWHIITYKFNYKQLEPYQCVHPFDVHKHGLTLLYYEGTYKE